jgi:hypothetical protein
MLILGFFNVSSNHICNNKTNFNTHSTTTSATANKTINNLAICKNVVIFIMVTTIITLSCMTPPSTPTSTNGPFRVGFYKKCGKMQYLLPLQLVLELFLAPAFS